MGLLDDAIREHLELKRAHGADPGDVARQEREAFGPGQMPTIPEAAPTSEPTATEAVPAPEPVAEAPSIDTDLPDASEAVPSTEEHRGAVSADRFGGDEDDIDWSDPPPLTEDPVAEEEPKDEDVLEETPEFLQETPEHDRLWFEQRPPKDFDF
jgi:hypothetical protein